MDIVSESDAFELHPVSGEIDFGDAEDISYRRLDEETLQARVALKDLRLVIVYLWCEGDQEGGGDGWRVSEVGPTDADTGVAARKWYSTIAEADDEAQENMMKEAIRQGEEHSAMHRVGNSVAVMEDKPEGEDGDDGDDDYWARYDKTPAAQGSSVRPSDPNRRTRPTSEADYFNQYAEVQPEMDNDDPSEDHKAIGESTLNGDVMASSMGRGIQPDNAPSQDTYALPNGSLVAIADDGISHPTASPPTGPAAVSRLEESGEFQSISEMAAKQHVSTSIKSLFRLCRSSGVERSDFDRMVRTELETLSMMEEDD